MDSDLEKRYLNYPKLNKLLNLKTEHINIRATPPMFIKDDLKTFNLGSIGKFDVILIDPPWEEYYAKN